MQSYRDDGVAFFALFVGNYLTRSFFINTTMLSTIRGDVSATRVRLNNVRAEYQASVDRLQQLEDLVPEKAEEMGMIK